ncbi:MAG: pyridoxal-dependent decarboxylase, partial [Proteobacteria bacterium]|nr:pyridoxal-dependent decarboxylase [Pseudomonadota bacterium]
QKTLKKALSYRRKAATRPWQLAGLKNTWQTHLPMTPKDQSSWHHIPDDGLTCDEVLALFESQLLESFVPVQNPYFMGHMVTTIPASVHEADIMISYLNQNMVKEETTGGASCVEKLVLHWFHQLIYQRSDDYYEELYHIPSSNLAIMVHGGTMGNLTALTIARNHALQDVAQLGIAEALKIAKKKKMVILSSERCHYSITKITASLGLGQNNLIKIPVNSDTQKICLTSLAKTIRYLEQDNVLIMACVVVASSTETGSVDDLSDVAKICQDHKIWMHVDAAWGGAYLLSAKLSPILAGIEQADSVIIDGHKLLGLTMGGGMVFLKDPKSPDVISQSSTYVLREDSRDSGRYHLEGSRPFYALKLWILCQRKGKLGLARLVEVTHKRARIFQKILLSMTDFIQTTPLETNLLTYIWCPNDLRSLFQSDPSHQASLWMFQCLNRIQDHIHHLGWSRKIAGFVSKTELTLNFYGYPRHLTVLRAIPAQATTTAWHMKDLLNDQSKMASKFFAEEIASDYHTLLYYLDSLPCDSQYKNIFGRLLARFSPKRPGHNHTNDTSKISHIR